MSPRNTSDRSPRRTLAWAAAATAALAALLFGPQWWEAHTGVGDAAPAFAAERVSPGSGGTRWVLAEQRGQPVLLDIWATWCTSCLPALQELEQVHREFGPQGLRVVAVSIDAPGEAARVRAEAARLGLTFDVVHDPQNGARDAFRAFGVPTSVLIDRSGAVRHREIGARNDAVHASGWSTPAGRARIAALLRER